MMSGVMVTKSSPVIVVLSQSESAPRLVDDTVRLSSFDKCVAPFPVTLLLAFDRPINDPVGTTKTALSRALTHYRPIAGRLLDARPGEGEEEPCIACTDEGVTFVAASAACALAEVTAALLNDLAVRYPGDFCRHDEPLLLMQVTEFSCGGFVVGVTFNHVAADGAGMAQFVGAVGELARGTSPAPSVVPVREWDDSLPGLPEAMVAAQKSTMTRGRLDLARVDVTVPWAVINRVKAQSGGTVFEAVAAMLWQCRTRAVVVSSGAHDDDSPAPLAFPSDVRAQVGATAGYYGNCVVVQMVPATSHAVASGGIGDLVALIRQAREKVPGLLVLGKGETELNDACAGGSGGTAEAQPDDAQGDQPELRYSALVVVSWRTLGFEAVDLGGGRPARVTWHEERPVVPGCVVCPPCGGEDDGVSVAAICVKPEHADAFARELVTMGVRVAPSNLCRASR
ncbi:hypothetical protein QOZ80_1AG0030010 [Eleusine coracana subsp. coracana]|nr:hypothetical protein QOZ80_1AG0030010 [Eleusine coracana subsp. coracana]